MRLLDENVGPLHDDQPLEHDRRKKLANGGVFTIDGHPVVLTSLLAGNGLNATYSSTVRHRRRRAGPFFNVCMIRSPCDYLLSTWSFQRRPGQPTEQTQPSCLHSIDMCNCMYDKLFSHELVGRAGGRQQETVLTDRWAKMTQADKVRLDQFLPFNSINFTSESNSPWQLAAQHFSPELLEQDRRRFSKWLRLLGGKQTHLLTMRYILLRYAESWHLNNADADQNYHNEFRESLKIPQDCPSSSSPAQEEWIMSKVAKTTAMGRSRCGCFLRTETMRMDMQECLLTWAKSCSQELIAPLTAYLTQEVFTRAQWREVGGVNPGGHFKCSEMMTPADQQYVWLREGALATRAGYTRCCHS